MELHLAPYQLCLAFRLKTTTTDGPHHLISQLNWFIFLPLQRTGWFGGARVGNLIFFAEKYTVGTVGTVAASTNRFVGAADNTSRLYKSICRGGLGTAPYKCMICRDSWVGAAGQTAPTNGYEPPLKIYSVVVHITRMTRGSEHKITSEFQ